MLLGGCGAADPARPSAAVKRTAGQAGPPGARLAAADPVRPIAHRDEYVRHARHETLIADTEPMETLHDGRKVIALTIDDGPSPVYTPQILRLLHRYKITASFSMIGINVAGPPGGGRARAGAGHMFGKNTW